MKKWNRKLWEQCDGTEYEYLWEMKWIDENSVMALNNECEYVWVMKWSDENNVMALNVNAYEWWYDIMVTMWGHCWKYKWKKKKGNYENSVIALDVNT